MLQLFGPNPTSFCHRRHERVEVHQYPQRICLVFLFGHLWADHDRTRFCALPLRDSPWCSGPNEISQHRAQFAGWFQPRCLWSGEAALCGSHRLVGRSWLHATDTTFEGVPSLWFGHGDHWRILVVHRPLCLVTVLISCCAIFLVLCQSASRSILTDSIPEGKREGIFVKQFVCYLLGTASGPVLAAVVILASSGSSSASHVKLALVCGLVVVAPIASIMFTFVDPLTRESMERGPKEGFAARPEATQGNDSNVRINVSNLLNLSVKRCTGRRVPILCVTFSVVSIVGGGLIAPFFTLFFKNDVHLSLVKVNLLDGCSWFFVAIFTKAGAWISKHFGRAPTMLSIFTLCTALTFLLRFGLPAPMLVVVFLFRRGLGSCIKPLLDSVVADFTPSKERGMWNAFLSIGVESWGGAALLGGILADQHGYTFVILVTSVVYTGSLLPLIPLVCLVSDETESPTDPTLQAAQDSGASEAGSGEVA